ncbi:hypothetical protein, partial [Thermococcus sp.]
MLKDDEVGSAGTDELKAAWKRRVKERALAVGDYDVGSLLCPGAVEDVLDNLPPGTAGEAGLPDRNLQPYQLRWCNNRQPDKRVDS